MQQGTLIHEYNVGNVNIKLVEVGCSWAIYQVMVDDEIASSSETLELAMNSYNDEVIMIEQRQYTWFNRLKKWSRGL